MKFKLTLILLLSYASIALSQPVVRNYTYKDTTTHVLKSARVAASEVCNNNIDDDNNGLVDDQDFACYFNGFSPTSCKSNSIIWSIGDDRDLYWFDLNTGIKHTVGKTPLFFYDVTWASNGKLYGIGGASTIYEIDPNTANITPLNNGIPPQYGNSMTADAVGNIYVTSGIMPYQINKINIASGDVCTLADLSALGLTPAGDLTFLNGMLYAACTYNKIAKVDLRTGDIKVMYFSGTASASYFGITSMPDGNLYVAQGTKIYVVDPVTMAVNPNPVIEMNLVSYGLTSYNEICQAPRCLPKASLQTAGQPPYCNTLGVILKGNISQVCNVGITDVYWTTPTGITIPGNHITAITPGKYYLNYKTTAEICDHRDSFTLQYGPNPPFSVDTMYQLPTNCDCNGSITVKAGCGSGNYTYNWSTGATTAAINNVCPGTYTVTVTDAGSGKDTTIHFDFPLPPTAIQELYISSVGEHCNQADGIISIFNVKGGTPPFQYALDNRPLGGISTFTRLSAAKYSILVKDAANCVSQQQVNIQAIPGPQKLYYTKQDAYCGLLSGSITIDSVKNGSLPFSFSLNNGPFNPQKNLTNLSPGPGNLTVKDTYGCTLIEPFTIFQSEQLRIAISPRDTNICASQKVTFTATLLSNNTGIQYSWDNGPGTNKNVFSTPVYADSKMLVKAMDNTGCTALDSATVSAPYCDSIFAKCVLFPNAFSPNQDGLNDTFGPHLNGCEIKSYQMNIYNRWGQLVFQTRDQSKKWNGAINGQSSQTGTYIFTCTWQDAVGYYHNHKGAVILVR